jgi:hypothetical protein
MTRPFSVIIITKEPGSLQERHTRIDTETSFPRLKLLLISLKSFFSGGF